MLYFITGNKNKFEEVKAIISDIEQLDVDLPEIQELDPKEVIRAKLLEALQHHAGEFIVEDTSVAIKALNGFPGPLIKWFLKAMGNQGLANLLKKLGDNAVEVKTIVGYAKSHEEIYFFEGALSGTIVEPRGESSFGWDPVFIPDGHDKTFAEMGKDEKNKVSYRRMAVEKLKEFLNT